MGCAGTVLLVRKWAGRNLQRVGSRLDGPVWAVALRTRRIRRCLRWAKAGLSRCSQTAVSGRACRARVGPGEPQRGGVRRGGHVHVHPVVAVRHRVLRLVRRDAVARPIRVASRTVDSSCGSTRGAVCRAGACPVTTSRLRYDAMFHGLVRDVGHAAMRCRRGSCCRLLGIEIPSAGGREPGRVTGLARPATFRRRLRASASFDGARAVGRSHLSRRRAAWTGGTG